MTKQHSPAAYNDVKIVMDLALERPGLIYDLPTSGKAIHFKQRCNRYRNMLRDMAQEQFEGVPGMRAETIYDNLVIRQQDLEGNPSRTGLRLVFDHEIPTGILRDPETGEEIDLGLGQKPNVLGDPE